MIKTASNAWLTFILNCHGQSLRRLPPGCHELVAGTSKRNFWGPMLFTLTSDIVYVPFPSCTKMQHHFLTPKAICNAS